MDVTPDYAPEYPVAPEHTVASAYTVAPGSLEFALSVTMAWSVLDLLEPLLLVVAGAVVFQSEEYPPQQMLFVLGLLIVPYLLRWIFYGAPSAGTLADLPLAILFLVITPVTIWVTPYFWELTWPELLRMLWGGAVFLGVINWALPKSGRVLASVNILRRGRLSPRLALLTAAYLLLGVALAALGLLNMAVVNKIPLVNTLAASLLHLDLSSLTGTIAGTMGNTGAGTGVGTEAFNPNRVAAVLILVAPFPLAWLLAWHATLHPAETLPRNPWQRFGQDLLGLVGRLGAKVAWLILWLFFNGALLLTQSRTALLATAVATLVVCLLTLRQPEGGLRLLGGLLFFGLLIGMAYFLLQIEFGTILRQSAASFDSTTTRMVDTQSLSGRVLIWQRALYGIADHPLTGYGLGTFGEIAKHPYPLAGFVPGAINHAHNLFLQTALDLGLPGLITFATIVGLAGLALSRCYRMAPPRSPQSTWAMAMLGSFTGFLTYNLFDGLTLGARPAVLMWFLLALAIAAGQQQAMIALVAQSPRPAPMATPREGGV